MNPRQRFTATMHYQPRDRSPICDFGFWDETLVLWQEQGLPASVDKTNTDGYFGMDPLWRCVLSPESTAMTTLADATRVDVEGVCVGLVPQFEQVVLEDLGDSELLQQPDGVRVIRRKFLSSIPMHAGHLLTDRETWKEHYLPRLDPSHPGRYPRDWDRSVELWRDDRREFPIFLSAGSLYGWIRNWMGLEAVSCTVHDDPAWFEEMVVACADCIVGVLERVLETGGRFDGCGFWEDMCYNSGPLLSPTHFRRFLMPQYARITGLLRRHGVDVIWVDCDGRIDALLPLWLQAGVNCMFPVEVGTWRADPLEFRRQYGRDLLMMGGFDKRILARSREEIEREVDRLAPLVEDGGFIGLCDHRVPPDVSLENYLHYLHAIRRVWGKSVNLRPMACGGAA